MTTPTRSSLLSDLLLRWQGGQHEGRPVTADEICADHPDLLPELREMIEALRTMQTLLDLDAPLPTRDARRDLHGPGAALSIDGYELIEILGQGGVGVVYKARQVDLDRVVAIKVLAYARVNARQLARFRIEVEAVARLHHPRVVQIYDVGEADGRPYFAMEWADGGTLADRLRDVRFSPQDAAELIEQLARAMHYVHERHILHRDLKPANVLFGRGEAKISDFGLAKRLDDDAGHTHTGEVLGTPSYMAPEQAEGRADRVGRRTDVYALGAILYEALTGRPPFKGTSPLDSMRRIVNDDPVTPSRLQSPMPRDLEAICLKCLEKTPADRYATAEALAEDLRRFLDGQPTVARRVGPGTRAVKWVRRHPEYAALAAAVLLIAGALSVGAGYWLRGRQELQRAAVIAAPQAREILQRNCYACHGEDPDNIEKKLDVLDHAMLLSGDRNNVVPGQPDNSRLIQRIEDGSMPPEEDERFLPRLSEKEVTILRRWIAGGAPRPVAEDPANPTPPVVPPSTLAAQVKAIFLKHCYKCHSHEEAEGGIKIMHHRLLVNVRKTIVPGQPERSELFRLITSDDPETQMPPKDQDRLPPAEVDVIRRWITEGAPPFGKSDPAE